MNRRLAWLAACSGLVVWGLAGAVGACGGSTSSDDSSTADSGNQAVLPGSSSGTGTSSSSGGVPEGGTDAGTDGSSTTLVSTPDKVACGAAKSCDVPDVCCATANDAGCQPAASTCFGSKQACDESADCAGTACCASLTPGKTDVNVAQAECATKCGGGGGPGPGPGADTQLCKTNAECPDAGHCYVNTCPGGHTIDACQKIANCTQ